MKKYINADLFRVSRRIPRWILIALVLLAMVDIFRPGSNPDSTIIELIDLFEQTIKYVPIYIGFIEMIYIFGDDFVGKTAPIAIGTGITRNQVIIGKWIEAIMVVAVDTIMIAVISLPLCGIAAKSLPVALVGEALIHMLVAVLSTAAYMALVFPIMYSMQTITVAFLIYILISSGAINKLIGLLSTTKRLSKLGIDKYTLTNCINVFRSRMILGSFQWESIVGIIIYVGAFLWLTCFIYKKKELEF